MTKSRNHSIRGKLTRIIMLISTTSVLLACLGFVASDVISLRSGLSADLATLASVVGSNSTAALTFGDRQAAAEVLHALRAKPSIIAACIYTPRGDSFAVYKPSPSLAIPTVPPPFGLHVHGSVVELVRAIELDHERIGTLYIASDTRDLNARLKQYAVIVAGIVLGSLFIAFVLSSRLQGRISAPIVELSRVAGKVTQDRDYTVRARPRGPNDSDEIGNLMTGFNGMLAEIEQRDQRLLLHQTLLEATVALRTGELIKANEELLTAMSIAEKVAEINARLARQSALILNSATDGIFGVDLDTEPSFLNPAGARMLGRGLEDLKGKSIHALIHHSRADGTRLPETGCPLGEALLRGEPFAAANDTFWRPDGTSFPVEYSATPMLDEEGNKRGGVLIFRDVTERRAVERLKSEFVSTVSHELRTPLTSIRGALGLLGSGLLGPIAQKAQRMLEIAVSNTDRLVRLINDILDLERIESGQVELALGAVDANLVMVEALEGLQSMADQAGVRLVIVPCTGFLRGDHDRIIQTLTNLLGNAIKFSPPDTTVTLSGMAGRADFRFCIADEGRGVPEQKLESIFERFSQVDASDSRDKGGSGLGLAICQSIVRAHGGRIWAERNDPTGSRFQFTIPLAVPSTIGSPAPEPPEFRTILICQNDSSSNVVQLLEHRGFRIETALTSADIIARAIEVQPDAIILDVTGGGDGRQIVEALEAASETRSVPIVVATGRFPEAYESYGAAVGDWARRPLKSGELTDALNLACGAPSILVVEDDVDLAGVMTTALQNQGIRTFHALSGAEAVRLSKEHRPNLVVLDLTLPDMDGFAVVSVLRESPALGRIPLLVYSAIDIGSADQARLRLGPTQFLTKSRCSLADFEGHVVRLLESVRNKTTEGLHAA